MFDPFVEQLVDLCRAWPTRAKWDLSVLRDPLHFGPGTSFTSGAQAHCRIFSQLLRTGWFGVNLFALERKMGLGAEPHVKEPTV
jgi:hypothetical protein